MTSNQETEIYLHTLGELQTELLEPSQRDLAAALLRDAINERHPNKSKTESTKSHACTLLEDDGFIRLDDILSSVEISEIKNYFLDKPCYNSHVSTHAEDPPKDYDYAKKHWKNASYCVEDIIEAPHLLDLITNPNLTSIVEEYFGCPPTLTLLNTFWSFPDQKQDPHETQLFHRDTNDFKFLTFFVYLTDVDEKSGPHCYIKYTHRLDLIQKILNEIKNDSNEQIGELASKIIPNELFWRGQENGYPTRDAAVKGIDGALNALFKPYMETICGKAGTAMLGDTYGFHKGIPPTESPRLMFWGSYGLYPNLAYQKDNNGCLPLLNSSRKDKTSYLTRHFLGSENQAEISAQTNPSKYDLGPSVNIYSVSLPDGTFYPNHITEEDPRPIEFIREFSSIKNKPWSDCTVIDLGCGEGTSTLAIGRTGARVIGIEGREHVVNRGRYMRDRLGYENVEFRCGDVTDPDLWENADALYVSGLIHHLSEPFKVLDLTESFISTATYYCTHFSPRTIEELESSEFHQQLFDPHTAGYRDINFEAIKFAEPQADQESGLDGRRHARSGIGNSFSLWPSEEGFIASHNCINFKSPKKLDYNPLKLRHRYFFAKSEAINIELQPGIEDSYLWPSLPIPSPKQSTRRAIIQDINHIKSLDETAVMLGDSKAAGHIIDNLKSHGIKAVRFYSTDNPNASFGEMVTVIDANKISHDRPEYIVLACTNRNELIGYYNRLAHQFFCKYIYTSFSLDLVEQ